MSTNGETTAALMTPPKPDDEFWIFGYGSLIWKPPPHFDRRVPGWVTGYVRRFWQASQDHRGTPTHPGRVVTLIERPFWASLADAHDSAPPRVWGTAYRIRPEKVAEVKEYLDIREINGYTIHWEPFHPSTSTSDSTPIRALVYIGTPSNDQFTGPQDPEALAEHVYVSEGPSGPNRDYLLSLERALGELVGPGPGESADAHVSDLAARVRGIARRCEAGELDPDELRARVWARDAAARRGAKGEGEAAVAVAPHEIAKVSSVEEQEETEKAV